MGRAMSYKRYSKYKDSGVEWIGEIPQHWDKVKIARLGRLTKANGGSKEDNADSGIPCIRYGELYTTYEHAIRKSRTYIRADRLSEYTPIHHGDVLFAASGETFEDIGRSAVTLLNEVACCGGDVIILKPESDIDPLFLGYALDSIASKAQKALMGKGYTVVHIYADQLRELIVALPPQIEQDAISSALDRETARIDALIEKKTRFVGLLKEKRQALITHAVTKGLDPNVKMKDSGVEWIGEVPEHWDVAQLGKVSISRCDGPFGSGLKSDHYTETGVRVVRLQNIGWAEFKGRDAAYIAPQYWRHELGAGHDVIPGDVLIAGLGDDNNPLGRACVAPPDIGDAMVKADCYRFRIGSRAIPDYVALILSATSRSECGFLATGATRDRLNLTLASARVIPLPQIAEQQAIVRTLIARTSLIDLLVDKTQHSITLLKERRAALITAAVTGQIDLREEAA
jgi:type I restriction enzyme S subunit